MSVIADETSDCGHDEQLSVVVCFFVKDKSWSLHKLVSTEAQTVFDCLSNTVSRIG